MSDDSPATAEQSKSMIERTDPDGPGGSTGERAQAMRAGLGIRREAEAMLAEASQLRQKAAADADAMVADAEGLAGDLVDEARARADTLVREAQERADGILARARSEAEELRANLDAERDEVRREALAEAEEEAERLRDLSAGLLHRAESGLRALPPALEQAVAIVTDALSSLEAFHSGIPAPRTPVSVGVGAGLEALPAGPQEVAAAPTVAGSVVPDAGDDLDFDAEADASSELDADPDARPLGWLFRSTQG